MAEHHAPASPAPARDALGVYVHFPWCLKKCPYCDFLSVPAARVEIPHAAYADAVLAELERRRRELEGRTLSSVFFGGGTPSLWAPDELARVLRAILHAFGASAETVEVTVECNPTSFDEALGRTLSRIGVNRLSIGVQGLDNRRLEFLGRLHDAELGRRSLAAAMSSGIPRVSVDYIFGVAEQPAEAARAELQSLAALGPTHLSAYALTIEPGTQFGALARRKQLPLLEDEAVADSFLAVEAELERVGFEHYEISNYARDGAYSLHNLGYWEGRDYLGLGTGAFGTLRSRGRHARYRNTPSPERYLASRDAWARAPLTKGDPLLASYEELSPETALSERLLLGLRLARGVDVEAAADECGALAWPEARARARDALLRQGRLEPVGSRLRVPKRHWLFADAVVRELL